MNDEFLEAILELLRSYRKRIHQLTAIHNFPMEVEDWQRDFSLIKLEEIIKEKIGEI